jgi:hypothetical protein
LLTPFVLGCFGVAYAWVSWFARGDLVVVAPRSALTVSIDGVRTDVPSGRSQTFPLARGRRSIVLESDAGRAEQALEVVDGFSRYLLAGKNQCFVLVDIAKSHYRVEGSVGAPPLPRMVTRIYSGEGWALSGNIYLPGRDPPTVYSGDVSLIVVREIDCELFSPEIGDRQLFEAAGLL